MVPAIRQDSPTWLRLSFSRDVDKGLAAANRGEFTEHDDVRKMIEGRYRAW